MALAARVTNNVVATLGASLKAFDKKKFTLMVE